MARNPKRSKARRRPSSANGAQAARSRDPLAPEARSTVVAPESIDEASGDAEQAKAAAEGRAPLAPLRDEERPQPDELAGLGEDGLSAVRRSPRDLDDLEVEEGTPEVVPAPDEEPPPAPRRRRTGARAASLDRDDVEPGPDGDEPGELEPRGRAELGDAERQGNPVAMFLRHCWDELQRVQWPDRREVAQATGVVLAFVVIAGGYLGLADALVQRLVNLIL